ncbi:hypothetical protein AMTR_s00047p00099630 [Amborella trichopoda]|uniref:Uncharacterized protein n=1 Tax=Amborella trichopoda TaxID=13333 RepID=U5D692_AMBTC|nr:hypothetical protein AMTR_s00047p00099630 [Amborella trichopoda]
MNRHVQELAILYSKSLHDVMNRAVPRVYDMGILVIFGLKWVKNHESTYSSRVNHKSLHDVLVYEVVIAVMFGLKWVKGHETRVHTTWPRVPNHNASSFLIQSSTI